MARSSNNESASRNSASENELERIDVTFVERELGFLAFVGNTLIADISGVMSIASITGLTPMCHALSMEVSFLTSWDDASD